MYRILVGMLTIALFAVPLGAAEPDDSTEATDGDCANVYVGGMPPVDVYPSNCRVPTGTTEQLP